jgi:hypothetical protein
LRLDGDAMRRSRATTLVLLLLITLPLCGGCLTTRGLLSAVADDLAFTTAAAAQGLVAGLLDGVLASP